MDKDIFIEKLKNLIIKNSTLTISEGDIYSESDLINDFGYDSVQVLRLLAEIEKEFGITFKDEDLVLEVIGQYGNLKEYVAETLFIEA